MFHQPSHRSHDVVVLGSGASGLTAALAAAAGGADVGLIEKSDLLGGATALSGGVCWVPNNSHMRQAGATDSREEALTYLQSLSHGRIDPGLVAAFVDYAPEAFDWVEQHTPIRFNVLAGFPDYHPENPGGKPDGGRSLEPGLVAFNALGAWEDRIVVPHRNPHLAVLELALTGGQGVAPEEMERRLAHNIRGGGPALIAGLLQALLEHGVEPWTSARARRLLVDDERVVGVEVETAEGVVTVGAKAVIIATGGFEWDPELVRDFLRGPMTHPVGVQTNTGDGLRMAMDAGAALGNMSEAWWAPVVEIPQGDRGVPPRRQVIQQERILPHCLMVNDRGQRFTNEAANYNALGGAFHQFDPTTFRYSNLPAWLVFDSQYWSAYGFLGHRGDQVPDWLTKADSLDELAALLDLDADALTRTVQEWNRMVAEGADCSFGRGVSAYDRWLGERSRDGALRTLGDLGQAPYFAVPVHSGALGTKGGPKTTSSGQVLDPFDDVIIGLYAVGNAMAGATGMVYGGGGGTLGPAVTFGYLAGQHAAGVTTS
ncbi:FAD-dependent oxidoreductase [Georgenia ruanii]|uniref:FAD-dependent oxidoreductase n=1 Tax=Georgenia ruanii TaxID=348442 RepID=A0A7J9UV69_9MICO|nr:FAD-dependent oxidoreductase [Georgenia ruanii]MPV88529.1 FAD-dependent oxidoreductase [Georgenia ruanii]